MYFFTSRSGKQFVKFINMLMNDTTFLLDESLESLKVCNMLWINLRTFVCVLSAALVSSVFLLPFYTAYWSTVWLIQKGGEVWEHTELHYFSNVTQVKKISFKKDGMCMCQKYCVTFAENSWSSGTDGRYWDLESNTYRSAASSSATTCSWWASVQVMLLFAVVLQKV